MIQLALVIIGFLGVGIAATFAYLMWEKSKIINGVQIQCSSGDSEVMVYNCNFLRGESEESKESKLSQGFQMIQDRRDENHEKYLAIKAAAIKENEDKAASGDDLKLRSITEGKK